MLRDELGQIMKEALWELSPLWLAQFKVITTPAFWIAAPVMKIAGVSIPFSSPDMVTTVRLGGRSLGCEKQAEHSPLLGRGVKDFRPLDKAQQFELRDYVITLPLLETRGGG